MEVEVQHSCEVIIETANVNHLNGIEKVASNCGAYLAKNNSMIYYLCCTVFSSTSFVYVRNNEVLGFVFAFPDSDNKYVWLHQFAVLDELKIKSRIGGFLFLRFINCLIDRNVVALRFAIRQDNSVPLTLIEKLVQTDKLRVKLELRSLGVEKNVNPNSPMEIFEIQMNRKDKICN